MFCYNLIVYLSVISTNHLMIHSLDAENILNGVPVDQKNFKYQAAIVGQKYTYEEAKLLCSGVVVAPSWVLSVARCFLSNSNNLKDLRFQVIVGSSDLTSSDYYSSDIEFLYTNNYIARYFINALAMVKTLTDMPLGDEVRQIGISPWGESFFNESGVVTGYGRSVFKNNHSEEGIGDKDSYDLMYDYAFFTEDDTEDRLRKVTVTVRPSSECSANFTTYTDKKFCGVSARNKEKPTGLCQDDIGSPLVIGDVVVGISTETHEDCDDTISGSLYTDVTCYFHFINNAILGNYFPNWLKHTIKPYKVD